MSNDQTKPPEPNAPQKSDPSIDPAAAPAPAPPKAKVKADAAAAKQDAPAAPKRGRRAAAPAPTFTDDEIVRVRCTLPNAASTINGVKFEADVVDKQPVMVSGEMKYADAKQFLGVTGFVVHTD